MVEKFRGVHQIERLLERKISLGKERHPSVEAYILPCIRQFHHSTRTIRWSWRRNEEVSEIKVRNSKACGAKSSLFSIPPPRRPPKHGEHEPPSEVSVDSLSKVTEAVLGSRRINAEDRSYSWNRRPRNTRNGQDRKRVDRGKCIPRRC